MKKTVKSTADKVIQIYMENDYEYVVSKAKAGSKLLERNDDGMIQFLKRNSIVPADMSAEAIQQVADIASRKIDEIESEIYRIYFKK